MSIAIFCEESSLFAAPFLAEALKAKLYVMLTRYNNFFQAGVRGEFWDQGRPIREEHLIVIGYTALKAISKRIEARLYKSVAFIISDSSCCREYLWWNKFVDQYGITLYAMPDLLPYCLNEAIPAYQTIRIKYSERRTENGELMISHSPNNNEKYKLKGSPFILKTVGDLSQKHSFKFKNIMNLSMINCLRAKSQSHIFIDQMIYQNPEVPQDRWGKAIRYEGGLGKSGIEAMLLGACVITGGTEPDTRKYFPPPPVVWSSYYNFAMDLERLLEDTDYRKTKTQQQGEWAKKYLNPEFVAKHITQHIK